MGLFDTIADVAGSLLGGDAKGRTAGGAGQGFLSAASPFLGQTFGQGIYFGRSGPTTHRDFQQLVSNLSGRINRGVYGDPLFAPGTTAAASSAAGRGLSAVPLFGPYQSAAINEAILNALPLNEAQQQAMSLLEAAPGTFASLFEPAAATAGELARTGLRTNIDPIRQAAVRQLRRETAPMLAEQFARQTGTFATDFLNSLNQAAGDVETNLGALQVELDEAAAQRRKEGAILASTLGTVPAAFAGDLFATGEQMRALQESLQPGARLFNALQIFSGLTQPGATGAHVLGFAPSQNTQTLAALSQGLGGIFNFK